MTPPKRRRIVPRILLGLLAVLILLVGIVALYINHLLNKIEFEDEFTTPTLSAVATDEYGNLIFPELELSDDPADGTAPTEYAAVDDSEIMEIVAGLRAAAEDDTEILSHPDVINIMLIGTDNRVRGQYRLSDAMILLSINRHKGKLVMTSLMRDTYAYIPGRGNAKLNAATAVGGPDLLLRTVRDMFRIDVQQYIMVDFYSLAEIIDVLGGVGIEVSEAEANAINIHVRQAAPGRELLSGSGYRNLTGPQAVGYARIRKIGNADFQRTERQRRIMNALIAKTKSSSIATLNNLLNVILPKVQTNISKSSFLQYMLIAPAALNYPVTQARIPASDAYRGVSFADVGDALVIDIHAARELLRNEIY